jgi:hypothetical protein
MTCQDDQTAKKKGIGLASSQRLDIEGQEGNIMESRWECKEVKE